MKSKKPIEKPIQYPRFTYTLRYVDPSGEAHFVRQETDSHPVEICRKFNSDVIDALQGEVTRMYRMGLEVNAWNRREEISRQQPKEDGK